MSTTTNTYQVTGMTCGHCVSAAQSAISVLEGVVDVAVELHAGGVSRMRVTSTHSVSEEQLASALEEAGDYHLASLVEQS